jgi:LruC domain-containing protein
MNSLIITVASGDNQSVYHKSYFLGNDSVTSIELNIPSDEDMIYINTYEITIPADMQLLELDMDTIIEKISPGNKSLKSINPISSWHLDEGIGNEVKDSESNNDGILSNASWVNGINNSGLGFNGENSNINIPNSDNLNVSQAVTIMAWAKSAENKTAKIAQKGDWDGYGLGFDKWNGWFSHLKFIDGSTSTLNWNDGLPLTNEWYHLAMTYDGSQSKLYVNGVLKNSQNKTGLLFRNNRPFNIGSDNAEQKFFNGCIDEVLLYSSALTAEEISEYYDNEENTDGDGDGVPDEEDDYPLEASKAFDNFWPANSYGTIMFEDLWPGKGDYDFNDMVLDFRMDRITNADNKLAEIKFTFLLKAIGTGIPNGFGFQMNTDNISIDDITASGSQLVSDYIELNENGLETNQDKPVIIVFDDANTIMPSPTGFGVNVEKGKPYVEPVEFTIIVTLTANKYNKGAFRPSDFNPFLIIDKDRGKEVHLTNFPPTKLADQSLFGTSDDYTDVSSAKYYITSNNLPWAILVPRSIHQALEKTQITSAYLKFYEWASSGGSEYKYWFRNRNKNINENNIYLPPEK